MEMTILLVILAAFGEAVIELLKPLLRPLQAAIERAAGVEPEMFYLYLSSVFGLLLAFSYRVNVLEVVGVVMPNQVAAVTGVVATGLAIGRGSNFVHDLIKQLGNVDPPEIVLENVDEGLDIPFEVRDAE